MQSSRPDDTRQDVERRKRTRRPIQAPVRLIVLSQDLKPVAERHCLSIDISPIGLAVSTPESLDPGTMVVVLMPADAMLDVWLTHVVHARMDSDGTAKIGLERREMPYELADAPWLRVVRSAA